MCSLSAARFGPGDLLVACADGITEAMDAVGTEFSRQRLAELVREVRDRTPEAVMRAVLREVKTHSLDGMYEDDRILMVMKAL
jgi:sigma-B regulation protein RsbU (phosphoserine phosphatase)